MLVSAVMTLVRSVSSSVSPSVSSSVNVSVDTSGAGVVSVDTVNVDVVNVDTVSAGTVSVDGVAVNAVSGDNGGMVGVMRIVGIRLYLHRHQRGSEWKGATTGVVTVQGIVAAQAVTGVTIARR